MKMDPQPRRQFVGEPITPVAGTGDARAMATGAPGLPRQFRWRDRDFIVQSVLETRRELGPCRSGSPEQYVRKHWFTVRTASDEKMEIYFDRQPRRGKSPKVRWWLHTISGAGD